MSQNQRETFEEILIGWNIMELGFLLLDKSNV